jgi:hypothetical protein
VKKKLQVFISSTYTDLLAERQAAVEAILRAGHIPAGMELFAAGDESQLETIRRWIDDSDVFMLILGGRYGSIEPKSGKSYIELEYDYATKNKKPLFAAVTSEQYLEAKVKATGPSAMETVNGVLLRAFRETVTKKICRFFVDINDLKLIVFESLSNFTRNEGLAGWIRGSDVVDPKPALEEMARLQFENRSLRLQVDNLQEAISAASNIGGNPSALTLNEDAKELLLNAKNDGRIAYKPFLGGVHLMAGNKGMISQPSDHREIARWKAAIEVLLEHRLVESIGSRGESFRVTNLGYQVADAIEEAARKTTTEPSSAADRPSS